MALELIYTSAEAGIKPGARGFCTVAASRELPAPLASTLESLSGYRHLFPPKTPNARLNPVACSHLTLPFNGKPTHVVSRIADAGLDYTDRTNKIAHHLVLQRGDLIEAGPAAIFGMPNMFVESWNSKPTIFPNAKTIPAMNIAPAVCKNWAQFGGDPGWGGVLAGSVLQRRPVSIVASVGMNLLPLFQEAIALLPAGRRWEATFSTYYSKLPPGVDALWKGVLTGSAEEGYVRALPRVLILDLTRPLGDINRYCADPATAALVETARTGKVTAAVAAAEDTASGSGPGLSFAKKTTTPGLAFAKKTPKTPGVEELYEDIPSDVPRSFNPMPGSYELAEPEWIGTVTPRRRVAQPKKKSSKRYIWAAISVAALLFLVSVGLLFWQYGKKVDQITSELDGLLKDIQTEMDNWIKSEGVIAKATKAINVPLLPKELEGQDIVASCNEMNDAIDSLGKFFSAFPEGPQGVPQLPVQVPEITSEGNDEELRITNEDIDKALENLALIKKLYPLLEAQKSYLTDFIKKKKEFTTAWDSAKKTISEQVPDKTEDVDKNKNDGNNKKSFQRRLNDILEEGDRGILKVSKDKKILEKKEEIDSEISEIWKDRYETKTGEGWNKKCCEADTKFQEINGPENAKTQIEGILAKADKYVKKDQKGNIGKDEEGNIILPSITTIEGWKTQLKEEADKETLLTLLTMAEEKAKDLSLSEPSSDKVPILNADEWEKMKGICDNTGWTLKVTLNYPLISNYNLKSEEIFVYSQQEENMAKQPHANNRTGENAGNGAKNTALIHPNEEGLCLSIVDNKKIRCSVMNWKIVDTEGKTLSRKDVVPLSRNVQFFQERQLNPGTVFLEIPQGTMEPFLKFVKEEISAITPDHPLDGLNLIEYAPVDQTIARFVVSATIADSQYQNLYLVDETSFESWKKKYETDKIKYNYLLQGDTVSLKWKNGGEDFEIVLYRCVEKQDDDDDETGDDGSYGAGGGVGDPI